MWNGPVNWPVNIVMKISVEFRTLRVAALWGSQNDMNDLRDIIQSLNDFSKGL